MRDSSYLIYVTQSKLTFELLLKVDLIAMKNIIFLLLSFFATLLPIISFSQMDDPLDRTIIQQIPSTNTQSQPGYIILATIIINDMEVQNLHQTLQ